MVVNDLLDGWKGIQPTPKPSIPPPRHPSLTAGTGSKPTIRGLPSDGFECADCEEKGGPVCICLGC